MMLHNEIINVYSVETVFVSGSLIHFKLFFPAPVSPGAGASYISALFLWLSGRALR